MLLLSSADSTISLAVAIACVVLRTWPVSADGRPFGKSLG